MPDGRRGADRLFAELNRNLSSYDFTELGPTSDLQPVAKGIDALPYGLRVLDLRQSDLQGIASIYRDGKEVAMLRRTHGVVHLGYDPQLLSQLGVDKRTFEEAMKGTLNPV